MKTLKEVRIDVNKNNYPKIYNNIAFIAWYETAIEWIYKDIMDSEVINVYTIEKYLKDLLNK